MSLIHSTHAEKRKRLEKKRRQNTIVMILSFVLAYAVAVIAIILISMVEQRKLLVSPWEKFKSDLVGNLSNALNSLSFLCLREDVPFRIEYARDIILVLAFVALVLMLLKFVVEGILCFLKHLIGEFKRRSRQRAVKEERTTVAKEGGTSPEAVFPPLGNLTTLGTEPKRESNVLIISPVFIGILLFFLTLVTFGAFANDRESPLSLLLVFITGLSYMALLVIGVFKGLANIFRKIKNLSEAVKTKRKQETPKVPLKWILKNLPQKQKVFLGLAVVAEALLVLLILNGGPDFSYRRYESTPDGFFTFLRIAACSALVGLLLENLSFKWKFPLLLLAILYNPVIPIRLEREDWLFFNIVTVPMLAVPWIILLRRLRRKDAAPPPPQS